MRKKLKINNHLCERLIATKNLTNICGAEELMSVVRIVHWSCFSGSNGVATKVTLRYRKRDHIKSFGTSLHENREDLPRGDGVVG